MRDKIFEIPIEEACRVPNLVIFKSSRKSSTLIWCSSLFLILMLLVCLNFTGKKAHPSLLSLKGPCPDFVGRKEFLEILYKDLLQGKNKSDYQKSALIKVLWGKGGFGKSELAIEFGNRFMDRFSLIWTIYCDSKEHIDQGYRSLAERLGFLDSNQPLERIKEKVHFYLENCSNKSPWLLIYDNVEDEYFDLPQRGGVILITSQKKIFNYEYLLEITPLNKKESFQLLKNIVGENPSHCMEELVQELDGIPLLLNYAAHYIKSTPGSSIDSYHKTFRSQLPLWQETDVNQRYLKSLAASWQFALKSLEKENQAALRLLYICSYLSPDHIPENWLTGDVAEKKSILTSFCNYGIIRYEKETSTFSIHRFFQSMIRENRKDYLEEDLMGAVELLNRHAETYKFSELSTWGSGRLWYLHACQIVKWLEENSALFSKEKMKLALALLFDGIGEWCSFNARYSEAIRAKEKALELRLSKLPPNDLLIAKTYVSLAKAFTKGTQFIKGYEMSKKGVEILRMSKSDGDFLPLAKALHISADCLQSLGRFEEAIELDHEALILRLKEIGISPKEIEQNLPTIVEKLNGIQLQSDVQLHENILDIADGFRSLGISFLLLKDYDKALYFSEKASSIFKIHSGKNHPFYTRTLKSIAWSHLGLKQYDSAQKLFEKILILEGSKASKDFLDIGYTYNGLAWCFLYKNDGKRALKMFQKTRNILKENQDEFTTLQAEEWHLRGMALSYFKCGHLKKGLKYMLRHLQCVKEYYQNTPHMCFYLENFLSDIKHIKADGATLEQIRKIGAVGYSMSLESLGEDHPLTKALDVYRT